MLRFATVTILLGALLCAGCPKKNTSPKLKLSPVEISARKLLSMMPSDIKAGVVVGDLGKVIDNTQALIRKLKGTMLGLLIEESMHLVKNRFRIDISSRAKLKEQGLAPELGAALFVRGSPLETYLILGVAKRKLVEERLKTVLNRAYMEVKLQKSRKFKNITVVLDDKQRVMGAFLFHQKYLILARGEGQTRAIHEDMLRRVTGLNSKTAFLSTRRWTKYAKRVDLKKGFTLYLSGKLLDQFLNPLGIAQPLRTFVATFWTSAKGVGGKGLAVLHDHLMKLLSKGFLNKKPHENLGKYLGADTILALVVQGNPASLFHSWLNQNPVYKKRILREMGKLKQRYDVDIDQDVIRNFEGSLVAGLYRVNPKKAAKYFDLTNLRGFVMETAEIGVIAKVTNPKLTKAVLKKLSRRLEVTPREIEGTMVYPFRQDQFSAKLIGKVAVKGNLLIFARGVGRMGKILRRLSRRGKGLIEVIADPESRNLLTAPGRNGLVISIKTLADNLKAIEGEMVLGRRLIMSTILSKVIEILRRFNTALLALKVTTDGIEGRLKLQ